MIIKELFEREIDRYIKAAVVANDLEENRVQQEISEYVFTDDLIVNFMSFLKPIAKSKENSGVWIKGFYGSGKSHFIKYLYYCLEKKYSKEALNNIEDYIKEHKDPLFEVSLGDFKEVVRKLEELEIDKILFNIAYSSGDKDRKDTITRIFLNELNKFRGYNNSNIDFAVLVEKRLDKQNKLNKFHELIEERLEENWKENHYNLIFGALNEILELAKELDESLDIDSIRQKVNDNQRNFSTEFMINEFKEYVRGKSDKFRLAFLVDEVSQYIGTNANLLLDLQTIVEAVSQDDKLKGKVWIVCTAQEDLGSLADRSRDVARDDFGKIMARFETKISLESQSASYITQRRLLDKKSEGMGVLTDFFNSNKGAIENQFDFGHDHYKGFDNKDEFIQAYPFVPYQFELISQVLESFQIQKFVTEGVKDSERSILGISHTTAKDKADNEVGYFVPFDAFFNNALRKDMTQYARNMIDRAYKLDKIKHDDFAKRVVNSLFMISNLGDTLKLNFPANTDNLTLIMMNEIDQNKADLASNIQDVLDELVKKNIIQFNEGVYRFLQEDEINVANLIESQKVNPNERLEWLAIDIIQPLLQPKNRQEYNGTPFKVTFKIDDFELFRGGDFTVSVRLYESSEETTIAMQTPKEELAICLNTWFSKDEELKNQLLSYLKTKKYLRENRADAQGQRSVTLNKFGDVNERLQAEIKTRFENLLKKTNIVSGQHVYDASEFFSDNVANRYNQFIEKHLNLLFKKQKYAEKYAHTNEELKASERSTQRSLTAELTPAEEEVLNKINLFGDGCSVAEIVKEFSKSPYGWKDLSTVDVILQLLKKNKKQAEWKNEHIDEQKFVDKALNSRERDSITLHPPDEVDSDTLSSFYTVLNNEIFPEGAIRYDPGKDLRAATEDFKIFLEKHLKDAHKLREGYIGYGFNKYFDSFHSQLKDLYEERNSATLLQSVIDNKEELKKKRDNFVQAKEFVNNQFGKYQEIEEFHKKQRSNYSELDETDQKRGEFLEEYFNGEAQPWESFPQVNKAYKELQSAIDEVVDQLKKDAKERYIKVFDRLEEKKEELEIDEAHLLPDKERTLKQIDNLQEITKLKLTLNVESEHLETEYLKLLQEHHDKKKAKKQGKEYVKPIEVFIAHEAKSKTINSEEELNEYISELKDSLLKKLKEGKRIFIH